MTAEIVSLAILGLILVALVAYSLWITFRAGGSSTRVDEAEKDHVDADNLAERMASPMPSPIERARAALRVLKRRGS